MTYVTDQTSQELRTHMQKLMAMKGWHEPLSDRLYKEILELDKKVAEIAKHKLHIATLQQLLKIASELAPVKTTALSVRDFEEWLNINRDQTVSSIFHDAVGHYAQAVKP